MERETALAIIGAIVIFTIYYARFNAWGPNEDKVNSGAIPRHYTTWGLYTRFGILYALSYELLFAFILYFPEVTHTLLEYTSQKKIISEGFDKKTFFENVALWGTIIITAIIPNLPKWCNPDHVLKKYFHKKAFITSQATSIIEDLANRFETFEANDDIIDEVIELSPGVMTTVDFQQQVNTLKHKWAKLCYLEYQFKGWQGWRDISRFMEGYQKDREVIEQKLKTLKERHSAYLNYINEVKATTKEENGSLIEMLEEELSAKVDEVLEAYYTLISCGILATYKTPSKRSAAFDRFGLKPRENATIPIDTDTIIKIIGVVVLSTLVTAIIYFGLYDTDVLKENKIPHPKDYIDATVWSVLSLLLQGGAIFISIFINNLWLKYQNETATGDSVRYHLLKPSLLRRMTCAIASYLVGLLVITGFVLLRNTLTLEVFYKLLPWPILSAVTGYFIAYYLGVTKNEQVQKAALSTKQLWMSGLTQGTISALCGVFAVMLFFNHKIGATELPFMTFVTTITFIIGLGIGYIFPEGVSKLHNELSRRTGQRFKILENTQVSTGEKSIDCAMINISETGAEFDSPITTKQQFIKISSDRLGAITGKVVRIKNKKTYVQFMHDSITKKHVQSYIQNIDKQAA